MSIASSNANNPSSPEFGKSWKPENNAGCLCNRILTQEISCVTLVQKFTRNDQSTDLISEKDCQDCSFIVNDCTETVTTNSFCTQ